MMAKDRSLVRASDLGSWTFCHRAWWLGEVKGAQHSNPAVLARGGAAHHAHGWQVLGARRLSRAGAVLFAAGVVMAVAAALWILGQIMG